jgi:dynein heavy chain
VTVVFIVCSFLIISLCDEYEQIAEKALATPANTEKLMELKAFIEKVENETIHSLEKKLVHAKNRLAFLVDHANFSPAEMRLNSNTFLWHGRMPAIFDEHKLIIGEKRSQYEEALKVSTRVLPKIFLKQGATIVFHCQYKAN